MNRIKSFIIVGIDSFVPIKGRIISVEGRVSCSKNVAAQAAMFVNGDISHDRRGCRMVEYGLGEGLLQPCIFIGSSDLR